jgi:hypothetical protein
MKKSFKNSKNRSKTVKNRSKSTEALKNASKTLQNSPKTPKNSVFCQNTLKYQDFTKTRKFPIAFPIIFFKKTGFLAFFGRPPSADPKNTKKRPKIAKNHEKS